jgi:formate/nitrite transporter FocA (FNT family)
MLTARRNSSLRPLHRWRACRYIKVLAHKKVSKGWGEVLVQGIFANWLVCIATWQANAAQDMTGKAVAVWLPISAFAMLGFEHCIGEPSRSRGTAATCATPASAAVRACHLLLRETASTMPA